MSSEQIQSPSYPVIGATAHRKKIRGRLKILLAAGEVLANQQQVPLPRVGIGMIGVEDFVDLVTR